MPLNLHETSGLGAAPPDVFPARRAQIQFFDAGVFLDLAVVAELAGEIGPHVGRGDVQAE